MRLHLIQHQTGAALITSLALLLVLTLIGLSAMNTTTLEEKMTGSVYNQQVSFQRAEAALRVGENTARQIADPNLAPATNGLYDYVNQGNPNFINLANLNFPVWDWKAGKDVQMWYNTLPADVPQIAGQDFEPSYIIEFLSRYEADESQCLNKRDKKQCIRLNVYRITARAQGLNNKSTSVVQSYFRVQ